MRTPRQLRKRKVSETPKVTFGEKITWSKDYVSSASSSIERTPRRHFESFSEYGVENPVINARAPHQSVNGIIGFVPNEVNPR